MILSTLNYNHRNKDNDPKSSPNIKVFINAIDLTRNLEIIKSLFLQDVEEISLA